MSEPLISVSNVTKTFDRGAVSALAGVSLDIREGEFVAITGPSGSGKSTLLHLIAALDVPSGGTVSVRGRDLRRISNLNAYRRDEVGLVFQLHNLLPNLTARENVEVAMFGTRSPRSEHPARARALLAEVSMSDAEERRPPKLSGGERQRVAIARALANDPPILLADEPTGSLDTAASEQVVDLMRKIRRARGITIVMVTHAADVAAAADRVVHVRDGAIEA